MRESVLGGTPNSMDSELCSMEPTLNESISPST
ncbi:hypothetical protein PF003_g40785 [Phytophthora fragariae]|nr:hypothetical protein PF003_g40785 [Phytophthora fragariae]